VEPDVLEAGPAAEFLPSFVCDERIEAGDLAIQVAGALQEVVEQCSADPSGTLRLTRHEVVEVHVAPAPEPGLDPIPPYGGRHSVGESRRTPPTGG
jgi:hypothetical protein